MTRSANRPASVAERIADWLPPRRRRRAAPGPPAGRAAGVAARATGPDAEKNPALLAVLNAEMNRQLDRQWDAITQLDTKAGLLVTFDVAAAGLLLSQRHTVLGYLALAAFVVALGIAMVCLSVRSWENDPGPDVLLELEQADPTRSYERLIQVKARSYRTNEAGLEHKADWLKLATWWTAVPVALAATSLLSR